MVVVVVEVGTMREQHQSTASGSWTSNDTATKLCPLSSSNKSLLSFTDRTYDTEWCDADWTGDAAVKKWERVCGDSICNVQMQKDH